MKTVIILSHPNYEASIANKTIVENLMLELKSSLEVRNLDKLYPDYKIDVKAEQEALINADLIIFQYPFFWYSTPAMLKHWIDSVFTYGFAFGSKGNKLKGKFFIQSITTGASKEAYTTGGNNLPIEEFQTPFVQMASLTQMVYQQPICSYGFGAASPESQVLKAKTQAQDVIKVISKL